MRAPQPYTRRMQRAATITAEQLLHLDTAGQSAELVRGKFILREPPGAMHGYVASRLNARISRYVEDHDLGAVFAAETGFVLARDPDTVRAPDVAFIAKSRLPSPLPAGYAAIAPDLAAEILSPNDRPGEVLAKVADWLESGTTIVWVIDPVRRVARVYRSDGTESAVADGDALTGGTVLPGFVCPLGSVL